MRNAKAYWRVFTSAVREDWSNPKRMVAATIQQIARVLLIVAIYRVAYDLSGGHTLSYANAMWTIGLCFTFFLSLGVRNLYLLAEYDIKTGAVETGLLKPLDWRLVKVFELLGKSILEFLLMLVVTTVVLLLIVGPPNIAHLNPAIVALFAVFTVMSVVTASALFMSVGLSAFWLNDAKSVFRIVDKAAVIFCGTFVPLAMLPQIIQQATYFLPFNIYAAPTRIFDPTATLHLLPIFISGLAWVAISLLFCQWLWRRAGKRIEVNGG